MNDVITVGRCDVAGMLDDGASAVCRLTLVNYLLVLVVVVVVVEVDVR